MDGYQRPRGPPSSGGRPSMDGRRPPGAPIPASTSSNTLVGGMTRAERFEDERKRITESCFSKLDTNGSLAESYITHIRIQEDAQYPQSPAPPNANPASKKPRVIIISVRNTGRVRLHKARENANGSFSIGKSWSMEDLSAVESFTHAVPTNEEEMQRKQWAGDVGFIVTIAKPYYWEAGTAKEKEFFIGSMIKIFNKYTQGKVPALIGFDQSEKDTLLRKPSPRPGQPRPSPPPPRLGQQADPNRPPGGPPPRSPGMPGMRPPPPEARSRPATGDDDRRPPALRGGMGEGSDVPPYLRNGPSGQPRPRPSMERGMRQAPSREQMRQPPSREQMRQPPSREQMRPPPPPPPTHQLPSPPQPPPFATSRLTPQSSRSDFPGQRPRTPDSDSVSSVPSSLQPSQSPRRIPSIPDDRRSIEEPAGDAAGLGMAARRPNGYSSPKRRDPSPNSLRPGTSQSNASSVVSRKEELFLGDGPRNALPERRRPPMLSNQNSFPRSVASSEDFQAPRQSSPPPGVQQGRKSSDIPHDRPPPGVFTPDEPPSPKTAPTPEPPGAFVEDPAPEPPKVEEPKESPSVSQPAAPEPNKEPEPTPSPASPEDAISPTQKKKPDMANILRKAAFAAGAFKPRAGGAAEKLFKKATESTEPDGISGVVPAPKRQETLETPKEEAEKKLEPEKEKPPTDRGSKEVPKINTDTVPSVTVSSPLSPSPVVVPAPIAEIEQKPKSRSPSPEKKSARAEAEAEVRRKRRRSNQQLTNISKLGVDPIILDDRGLEFEALLGEFGWGSSDLSAKNIDTLEADIRREISRVEAGSWLNHLDQKDDRVDAVEKMLDRAIAECDELEGLLTLYNVELSSLNDDVAFIEAQSQGLQVQTANQKLLQTELQQLVETISITPSQLEALRRAQIAKIQGLEAIESALLLLYKALVTIDPSLAQGGRSSTLGDLSKFENTPGFANSELASMRALQEKKDRYLTESSMFLDRLQQHMDMMFGAALLDTKDALSRQDRSGPKPSTQANVQAHDLARNTLWQYGPLLLFAKEIDRRAWENMLRIYQGRAAPLYQDEIRDNVLAWKRNARKATGEEQELLFTAQEKEPETITGAARKLTVKRSQTLARGLRSASGDKEKNEKAQSGKLFPFQVFAGTLDDVSPLILTEQNFVTDFFHATSADNMDFPDAINAAPPDERRPTNFYARKLFEPDRAMAKRVTEVMEEIFSFWPTEVQNLVEWAVKADPLQGVGVLCAVDRKMVEFEDSNQDFLTRTLQKLHERLTGLFTRFVDEQIRAIEDTKVKIKKRKGVIAFIKTFPHFSLAIENMLPSADDHERLEVRTMVDDAYQRINKAMFESLKVIAKESPAVMATQGQGDPEDKEALNYHILLIENMNHYIEEVDDRADSVLGEWRGRAGEEMNEHMTLYVDAVVRRPLGKLLDFVESTETLLSSLPSGTPPSTISNRSSHSRSLFRKLVSSADGKDIRKGIDALKKRVEKHFGDADDPGLSRNLVAKVLKECEKKYADVYQRTVVINQDVYAGEVEIEWRMEDVGAGFRR